MIILIKILFSICIMNQLNSIEDLCKYMCTNFKACTGEQKLSCFKSVLEKYKGDDWKKYVTYSNDTYNRNLVYNSDKFDIFILSWKAGQKSKIHDHPEHGCLLKVLQGQLIENLYIVTKDNTKDTKNNLTFIKSTTLEENNIAYKQGNEKIHDIHAITDSVSLHIYSPGNYRANFY
jgi:cysteine dioxygenase